MKLGKLLLLAATVLIINPRVNFDGTFSTPRSVVSCSTGWSFHWGKVLGRNDLLGIYSLDTAAQVISLSVNRPSKASRPVAYQIARDLILESCK